jgi:hypothetical protein
MVFSSAMRNNQRKCSLSPFMRSLSNMLTREMLIYISRCSTAVQAWKVIDDLYSSQSHARLINTRIALATTKKNQLSVSDYYGKMCAYADKLEASGAPLCDDDELVTYFLASLERITTLSSMLSSLRSIRSCRASSILGCLASSTTPTFRRLSL